MAQLLSIVFGFLRRHLLTFLVIVLVLACGRWIQVEWSEFQSRTDELTTLENSMASANDAQLRLQAGMSERMRRLGDASSAELDRAITTLDGEIHLLQRQSEISVLATLGRRESISEQLRLAAMRGIELELRRQARDHLVSVRAHARAIGDRQAAQEALEQLRIAHVAAFAALARGQRELAEARVQSDIWSLIPFTREGRRLDRFQRQLQRFQVENSRAHQAYLAQQALLSRVSIGDVPEFKIDATRVRAMLAPLHLHLRMVQSQQEPEQLVPSFLWKSYLFIQPVLPAAVAILLGVWLLPAALRTLCYFVLAPAAGRLAPLVLAPGAGSSSGEQQPPGSTKLSSTSCEIRLEPGQEMLIRPDFCQSQAASVLVTTKLLFDWRYALTSIAANLWLLKHISVTRSATMVLSSTADPLDEVALFDVRAGESFILQPRALAGVVYAAGQVPRIRSRWRLGTLHAWLTFQLRYLAFEGPATLILKGCRGVRLESADGGRSISQDATLGFSGNARYRTIRAEPFIPYLLGRQALFHDSFDGEGACYLYEEVPRNERPGESGRGPLGGALEAGMKAFGI
ncbi:MAG: hypothetical protein V4723_07125 [Pseudomonadota bacterium]